ncbi:MULTISPECIES: hypothetical protein [unclassified Synechococcus]|uniref:hypothetical protein n=1 Tax=unclassified Synechococcus TaxID=2626047 RepID=UPI0021A8C0A7|nr:MULTISPECIES: hypothetical protein [unclassified Synechococcus]
MNPDRAPFLSLKPLRRGLAVAAVITLAGGHGTALAASPLLESVKQNPQVAKSLCNELRQLNGQGIRSTSPQAIAMVAQRQNISLADAEIVTTYVVGLHCPDVR